METMGKLVQDNITPVNTISTPMMLKNSYGEGRNSL